MQDNTTPIIATPAPGDDAPQHPDDPRERHAKQTDRLAALDLINKTSLTIALDKRFEILSADRPGEAAALSMNAEKSVYAFNVIVALEWQPSEKEQQQLIEAFKRAAAFLYDVTDGCMSFGQIVFGGLELMDCADIQIMASNRFNPRSWVNALMDQTKYMPIRVGRGVWLKNQRRSIPWVEPEGYRTLIHEWAHYALALRDEYLETEQVLLPNPAASADSAATRSLYTLIVPGISLATESIMGSLEGTSELVPLSSGNSAERKSRVWNKIKEHYHEVNPDGVANSGPYSLPPRLANVPVFFVSNGYAHNDNGTARALTVSAKSSAGPRRKSGLMLTVPSYIIDEHCWIYVVKPNLDNPRQVIAQGTFDARSTLDNFQLLNADRDDWVVLVGDHQDGSPIVLQGKIAATVYDEPSGETRAV
ncbi:MAG: hypothetical protein JOZ51_10850, partial [Chloroflexi bacterium]|nr:hypothetical protein [Chloroflexota bacterium]